MSKSIEQTPATGRERLAEEGRSTREALARSALFDLEVVAAGQLESERKKNTTENLRMLQNRFGERFVKGDLKEGGGYTDGAARELLAGFMDRAGFAGELKRIIPNKYGALQLLRDNHAYIQTALEQLYGDDLSSERTPIRDPYELARSAGYELTGPFVSTSEFVPLDKQDFQPSHRLCTFNDPVERLENYNILWLRHNEVESTLPANKLTADTLSDKWKTYLKAIGRYDQDSDRYDISDLEPSRDDPYGTSSMSVQISRKGAHVSIKNRYNDAVGNPDNTLDSNLDNVVYGLRCSIYAQIGREDLIDRTSAVLAEGYTADSEGGVHTYRYEEGGVYYGDYEYIKNGTVTSIDRGAYYMISPQLYIPMSSKGKEVNLRPKLTKDAELAVGADILFLGRNKNRGDKRDVRIVELRQARAERDRTELAQLLHETIMGQARSAYSTYKDIAEQLASGQQSTSHQEVPEVMTEAAFVEQLERKGVEWQKNGTIDYLVHELIQKDSRPSLVAVPNIQANWRQIKELAEVFGRSQPRSTYVNESFFSQYRDEELSGELASGPLRLSIIPSVDNMEYGTVEEQRNKLAAMQAEQPELNFRVPSVLEAISYWSVLRRRGAEGSDFRDATIRHFDQPEYRIGDWMYVPSSYVLDDGGAYLSNDTTDEGDHGRISVG